MVFDRIFKIPVQTAIQTKNSACPDLATHLPQILSKRQTERVLAKSLTAGIEWVNSFIPGDLPDKRCLDL